MLIKKYNIPIRDITREDKHNHIRQYEIVDWLARYENQLYSFVIFDDEYAELKWFYYDKLIITSDANINRQIQGKWYCREGLRRKHIRKAKKILNNNYWNGYSRI